LKSSPFAPEPLPPDFQEAFARSVGTRGRLGARVLYFSTVGSTNDVAMTAASEDGSEGLVVLADAQTAGRGRRGRQWFSPDSNGLYVSVVLDPSRAAADRDRATALLTLAAGVAIAEGIGAVTGFTPDIKWPNDLIINQRKVGGILAEAATSPAASRAISSVVLGYGLNVGTAPLPGDLADRATSLESELGRPVNRADLCVETLIALARRYDDLLEGRFDAILDAWIARAPASRGARVHWETPSGPRSGVTAGVDDRGALLVRVGERTERLIAGEVNWT